MWSLIQPTEKMHEASRLPSYVALLRQYRKHVDYWQEHFTEDVSAITGWMHHYLCPECSAQLFYDPDKLTEHICPMCEKAAPNTVHIL